MGDFLNLGTGEILVIALLALILFGPEDIVKLMRKLGEYTRTFRQMWSEFSKTVEEEYASSELAEVVEETKASLDEAGRALDAVRGSMSEVAATVQKDVEAAQKSLESEASAAKLALEKGTREARRGQALTSPSAREPSHPAASLLPLETAPDVAGGVIELDESAETVDSVERPRVEPAEIVEAAAAETAVEELTEEEPSEVPAPAAVIEEPARVSSGGEEM